MTSQPSTQSQPDLPPAPPSSRASSPNLNSSDSSKFQLLAELGRGGMATVFLAVVRGPAGFNKLMVVKCLRPSLAAEPEFLEMFLAEARLAARINHPNVVQTNEVGFDGSFYYIAMEYVEGPTLEAIARKAKADFPVKLYMNALLQTLNGLDHAHDLKDFDGNPLNVVHRDVSPHNIMVSYDGSVKLLDFGIAKAADSGGNTRTGILKGKCAYMAAEQFGGHDVDRRADIFAAGVILWQAITGTRLWTGLSDAEIFARISRGEIPSPKTVKPDAPDQLVDICMKALAPQREDRYATCAEFASALEGFIAANPSYHATARELGKYVSELFANERKTMAENVDKQRREVEASGQSLVSFGTATTAPGIDASSLSGARPIPRSNKGTIALLALVAGLGIAGFFVMTNQRKKAQAAQDTAAATANQAKVTIHVTPENAKIMFDDAPLSGNPATASLGRDGLSHLVRAEAPGYVRKTQLIVLDNSTVNLDIDLEKQDEADEVDPFGNKLTAATLTCKPQTAHLYLDGILLPDNPTKTKLRRDGKEHEMRCDLAGHIGQKQMVKFDGPKAEASLTLVPDPAAARVMAAAPQAKPAAPQPAAASPTPEPAAAAPAPAPAPAAAPTNTGKRLDRSDPWGN